MGLAREVMVGAAAATVERMDEDEGRGSLHSGRAEGGGDAIHLIVACTASAICRPTAMRARRSVQQRKSQGACNRCAGRCVCVCVCVCACVCVYRRGGRGCITRRLYVHEMEVLAKAVVAERDEPRLLLSIPGVSRGYPVSTP